MIDGCGRNIDYLRISLTDRCNLRCIYCMPETGIKKVEPEKILKWDEILRICRVMAGLGITRIRLTGGEPLVRPKIPRLIREIKEIPGIRNVTLTTNGVFLEEQMEELFLAGLDGLNISLDTLDAGCYETITRRDELEKVKRGIQKALQYPSVSLKINCVPLGIEKQKIRDVAELARIYPLHVRFIEMMPIGRGKEFSGVPEEKIKELLTDHFGEMTPYEGVPLGNGPCHYYELDGFQGKIGFISAVSHKFCGACNRIRLTSQGYLKTCLQYTAGADLRAILRSGGTDEELTEAIRHALEQKPDGHRFEEEREKNRRNRRAEVSAEAAEPEKKSILEKQKKDETETLCMSQIGG